MNLNPAAKRKRATTPTVIQMEAVECGAAALAIILGHYGRWESLAKLRVECGVSRDGSKAANVLKAARAYGLEAQGFRKDLDGLRSVRLPVILFWNFNHFLVMEGFDRDKVFLNDPASGPRTVGWEEFNKSYTGVTLTFQPTDKFQRGGHRASAFQGLKRRARGAEGALSYVSLVSLLLVLPGILGPAFLQIFVDRILNQGLHRWILWFLEAMLVTILLELALTWVQQYYLSRLQTRLTLTTAASFFWHALNLPLQFFSQRSTGDIASRVELNDKVAGMLSGQLATAGFNLLMIGFYLPIMFLYDHRLTAVAVVLAGVNGLALRAVARFRKDATLTLAQEQGKLAGTTMFGLAQIETLKASGREGDFFTRWSDGQARVINAQQEVGVLTQALSAVPTVVSLAGEVIVLVMGGLLVIRGQLTLGGLMAFKLLMSQFLGPVGSLVGLGSLVQEIDGDLKRLDDILDHPREAPNEGAPEGRAVPIEGAVEMRSITFGYNPNGAPLLSDFSLSLAPGQRVALVGSTGSGKSTLGKLLCGLHKPWSGTILIDGRPLASISESALGLDLAQVDQNILLFEGTIRDNLTLWDPEVPLAALTRAVTDAGISDTLARRGGLDTWVEEGGRNFSGGERQRLELARALVTDPAILVLDEATSALDPLVEKQIDERLRRRGCTCVIVAHRLSTIRDCDEIVVLEKGQVVERGTHETLIAKEGAYWHLVRSELEAEPA